MSLAIEMFNQLHSALPALSRAIHLARGAAGTLSLMRQGARAVLIAKTPPGNCVTRGLSIVLDSAFMPDISPSLVAMGRILGEPATTLTAPYAVPPTMGDSATHRMRNPVIIRIPAQHLNYVTAPDTLHESNPAIEGPIVDVLALRVGQGVIFNTFTPAVRALLHRCRDGRRTEAALLEGIPQENMAAAKRLISIFADNGLTAFDAPEPTAEEEAVTLRLQTDIKNVAVG